MSKICFGASLLLVCAGSALAQPVVFQANPNSGYFTPFNTANAATVKYGDSGWYGSGSSFPDQLFDITLRLAANGGTGAGSTDIVFTFNDGDPAQLDFGSGAALLSTTIKNVAIPDSSDGAAFFDLTIPLPGVFTTGGFNNVGWSVALSNFNYSGSFGFQTGNGFGQPIGFYTNNAVFYNGSSWSKFAFGAGIGGVANLAATIRAIPTPGALAATGMLMLAASKRRRAR